MNTEITIVECPRDAMQGWETPISTKTKISYLNTLLQVGFDVLDFGSFVSPKAIPQLADTKEVLAGLDLSSTSTRLLAIVANVRGASDAAAQEAVHTLGFPFSISETFQLRNTNKTIAASLSEVEAIQEICMRHKKELVIYISMGFGNPYGDPYNADIAIEWVNQLAATGVQTFAISDTVGVADADTIRYIFSHLVPAFKNLTFGAHFHSTPESLPEKLTAAWESGCRRFDGALKGIGGCPMASDELVGNVATEQLIQWCDLKGIPLNLDRSLLQKALLQASEVFRH